MTIDEAIDVFGAADEESGYEFRRYSACIAHLNGVVAIADEDGENGSSLEMYTADAFIQWMTAAVDSLANGEFEDIIEAVNESRPEPAQSQGH